MGSESLVIRLGFGVYACSVVLRRALTKRDVRVELRMWQKGGKVSSYEVLLECRALKSTKREMSMHNGAHQPKKL